MNFYIGVDSGGTKTQTILVNASGDIIASHRAGSTDIFNISEDSAKQILSSSIETVLLASGLKKEQIDFTCFAMSTYGDAPSRTGLIENIAEYASPSNFIVVNDVRAALEGAHPLNPGIVILIGTGAMIMGKDKNNNVFRVDGWGENAGDLGSGYYIGKRGLQEAFKAFDGRNLDADELLKSALANLAENDDVYSIIERCKGCNSRAYIAGFCKHVTRLADAGNKSAKKIIDDSLSEIHLSIKTIMKRIPSEKILCSYAGSVFKCTYFKNRLDTVIKNEKRLFLKKATTSPSLGAVILAIKEHKPEKYDSIIKNITDRNS
jgi:N-acetylglucosamine kinase-like BadF-type ATPase